MNVTSLTFLFIKGVVYLCSKRNCYLLDRIKNYSKVLNVTVEFFNLSVKLDFVISSEMPN